jgi:hypothetical protein
MRARIPSLEDRPWLNAVGQPAIDDVMDMIEFCYASIGKPVKRGYHSHFKHDHLDFDAPTDLIRVLASIMQVLSVPWRAAVACVRRARS